MVIIYSTISPCSFFAVHPVSMNSTNRLISGDNKGYASYMTEMDMNPGTFHGQVININVW